MSTYRELQEQAEKLLTEAQQRAQQLLSEAESIRSKERLENLELVRTLAKEYGFTAKELGLAAASGNSSSDRRRRAAGGGSKASKQVKYRGPNGETWSGGRGRRPAWVQQLIAQGKDIEAYRVRPT